MLRKKRLLYLLLFGLFLLLGHTSVSYAADAKLSDFTYTGNLNGVVTITRYKSDGGSRVDLGAVFPDATEIRLEGQVFKDASLTEVIIPKTVSSITSGSGDVWSAFYQCESLRTVIFEPRTTETLVFEDHLFSGCENLTSLELPDTVTSIPDNFCQFASSLKSVKLPSNLQSIGSSAFANCKALTSITIPKTCTSLGAYAFDECTSLASVTFENPEEKRNGFSMGKQVFYSCAFTDIVLPEGCTSISEMVFQACSALQSVTIPESCTVIGYGAFLDCGALNQMNSTEPGKLVLPTGCTTIGESAFKYCTSIQNVYIPEKCSSIGGEAFWKATNIRNVTFENANTAIGKEAFSPVGEAKYLVIYCEPGGEVAEYAEANNLAYKTNLAAIRITKSPNKTEYYYKQDTKLDYSGMEITAYYTDEDMSSGTVNIEDCIIRGFDNTRIGERIITVSYGGKQATFSVSVFYNLINANVDADTWVYTYTGQEIIPEITVTGGETKEELVKNKDYMISCSDNTNVGTATATLTGIGNNYRGTKTVQFYIQSQTSSGDNEGSGNQGGNTGGDNGDSGNQGENTGGDNGDSGNQGENSGGDNEGSGNQGGITGGGNNVSGNQGGVTEGNGSDNGNKGEVTDGNNSGNSGEIAGNVDNAEKDPLLSDADNTQPVLGKTYIYKDVQYRVTGTSSVTFVQPSDMKIKKLTIPSTVEVSGQTLKVTKIDAQACYNCKQLTTVTVGNNVEVVGNQAFAKCTRLKKITFGKGLKKLGKKTFYQDKNLKQITIKSTKLKSIGKGALKGVKKVSVKAPKKKVKAYQKLFMKAK